MMSKAEIGLIILIIYLFIGTILWLIGMKSFGGAAAYREYLDNEGTHTPIWLIFLAFVIVWPAYLRLGRD